MLGVLQEKIVEDVYSAIKSKIWNSDRSNELEIRRWKRDFPPQDYILKIPSFSTVKELDKHESGVFEAGGYKWRLHLYPNGNKAANVKGHVSLYLSVEDTATLPRNWEVLTDFKLFLFDQKHNNFLTVQVAEGAAKHFHEMKKEWGFSEFISLETFDDVNKGFLLNDCCYFGAEVVVIGPTKKHDSLTSVKQPATNESLNWPIEGFSKLDKSTRHCSRVFTAGQINWKLRIYPHGDGKGKGQALSIYLELADPERFPIRKEVWAEFKLRVLDQRQGRHVVDTSKLLYNVYTGRTHVKEANQLTSCWFGSCNPCWGFPEMISLEDLYEASKGFIRNDTLIVEVEFLTVSAPKTIGTTSKLVRDVGSLRYSLEIESFSLLAKVESHIYESDVFEAGGYKWRLYFYPNGNKESNGQGHISLYLQIEAGSNALPDGWQVNARIRLFVLDQISKMYLTFQDGEAVCFHKMQTDWGFAQLLSLETFNDTCNGFLVNDCCVLGAEIFCGDTIGEPICIWDTLSLLKQPPNGSFTWKIRDFSKLTEVAIFSKPFTAGGKDWRICAYPEGKRDNKGNFFSVYLDLVDPKKLPPKKKVYAEFKLRVLNQHCGASSEKRTSNWFTSSHYGYGYSKFMALRDLREGFVVDDTLIIEAEILAILVAKRTSHRRHPN